ncbi:hypothetical protein CEY11_23730 [Candidimonas nitroreducens]|uniref:Uncharacterized protein n=1 Tax=Candidimonas nitroreducens TaxID=683354 RepID=A0A225LWU1_9BURK|nr:hypothetical protein CEY11_23730 [Candidimonas nitroreducens]
MRGPHRPAGSWQQQAMLMVPCNKPHVINSVTAALTHIKAGRAIALAVTTSKRIDQLPEAPTVAESGYPGFEAIGWAALFAPRNTPPLSRRTNCFVSAPGGAASARGPRSGRGSAGPRRWRDAGLCTGASVRA